MKIFKNFLATRKRQEEMKNYKAQIDELEAKVSAFLQSKWEKNYFTPRSQLTKRLPRFILSKDDAVAFFGEFLGEDVNKHLVALVELEEQYSPQKNKMLCWIYKNFFIRLTDREEYGYFSPRMYSKLVIIDKIFHILVAPYANLRVEIRGEEITPIDIIYDEWGEHEHIRETLKVYSAQTPLSKVLEDIKSLK